MTLCEIVAQAKEGDRFQANWMLKPEHEGSYYYMERKALKLHHIVKGRLFCDEAAELSHINDLTANYTFLPPEPKFQVGDRVKLGNAIEKIEKRDYASVWSYLLPFGWYREERLELHTGPDTCDKCGQVRPLQNGEAPEPPIEWDSGDLPKWKAYFLDSIKWGWVAEKEGRLKQDWPGWIWNGGSVAAAKHDCFACECSEHNTESCNDCIMGGLWGGNCCEKDSPFRKWELTRATHHAQTIADVAKQKH